MSNTAESLTDTLLKRLVAAGFKVPKATTAKHRASFGLDLLEKATVVPTHDYNQLVEAARQVVLTWETNKLAEAVRNLDAALPHKG